MVTASTEAETEAKEAKEATEATDQDPTGELIQEPSRWRHVLRSVRRLPEPVQLIYVLMFSICLIHRDKIYIDKVCEVDLRGWLEAQNLSIAVCEVMTKNESFRFVEKETQERVSRLKLYEGLIMNIPSIVFATFSGSWADQKGRKVLLAAPFVGNLVSFLAVMLNILYWDSLTSPWLLLSGMSGLTGGYICLNIGLYSYISDTTTSSDRTFRMSLLNGVFSLGYIVGVQVGGRLHNYYLVFSLATALSILGFVYSLFVLEESLEKVSQQSPTFSQIFNLKAVIDCGRTTFKRRQGRGRTYLMVLLFQFQVFMLCLNTTDFDYLMTRLKFGWEKEDFSNYLTVQRACRLAGLWLVLPLLSRGLRVGDSWLVSLGCLVTCLGYSLLGLASREEWGGDWPVFLSAVLQLNSVTTVAIRSRLSKLVEAGEIGRIFAVVGILQSIISLCGYSLLSQVYTMTLSSLPTAYLVPVVALLAISFLLSLVDPRLRSCQNPQV